MKYKGYTAQIEYDEDAKMLFGKVLDIKDVITFKSKNADEIEQEFHLSVDDYLEWCKELGEEPAKVFSGKLPYRTTPETHRKIFLAAEKSHKSINAWMDEVLKKVAEIEIKSAISKEKISEV